MIEIRVPCGFEDFMASAAVRISYLRPELEINIDDRVFKVEQADQADALEVKRLLLHAVYREKILFETMGIRRELVGILSQR